MSGTLSSVVIPLVLGFSELRSASCVFWHKYGTFNFFYLLVYVDGLLVLCTFQDEPKAIVAALQKLNELCMLDEGDLFLGAEMRLQPDADGRLSSMGILQSVYTESFLRRFVMHAIKPCSTPMVKFFCTCIASEDDKAVVDTQLYQQMIGPLMYLALRTRPNTIAAVLILARFQ